MKQILFICTGNYYRSRYAEARFNYHAEQKGLEWKAFSRGLSIASAPPFGFAAPCMIERLEKNGIPLLYCSEKPVQLAEADLQTAQRVIALKRDEHYPMMQRQFPSWRDRIEYWGVNDLDVDTPETALAAIDDLVESLLRQI